MSLPPLPSTLRWQRVLPKPRAGRIIEPRVRTTNTDFIYCTQQLDLACGARCGSGLPECVRTKSLQSCLTLCDPMDYGPPCSSVHGILQARILEEVEIPFSWGPLHPGIEPRSPALQKDSLPSEPL